MRAFFICLFVSLSSLAFPQGKFKLHVTFNSVPGDSVKLVFDKKIMTIPATVKEVIFEGEIEKASRASLSLTNSKCLIPFYLEASEINIEARVFTVDDGEKCIGKTSISGSKMESVMQNFENDSRKIRKKYEPEFANRKIKELAMNIIREYPSHSISVDLVMKLHKELGSEWALAALEPVDENIKAYAVSYVKKAGMSTEYLQRGNYIDFTLPALEDSFTLSSLKGKYVLLDFWASWCMPCRKENPKLKQLYERYRKEGLEIVGVSLDHDGDKWEEAIQKDGLPWIHVSDLKGWQNSVSSTLGISSIPTAILLDKEGRIIDYGLRGNELEKTLEKLFSKKD